MFMCCNRASERCSSLAAGGDLQDHRPVGQRRAAGQEDPPRRAPARARPGAGTRPGPRPPSGKPAGRPGPGCIRRWQSRSTSSSACHCGNRADDLGRDRPPGPPPGGGRPPRRSAGSPPRRPSPGWRARNSSARGRSPRRQAATIASTCRSRAIRAARVRIVPPASRRAGIRPIPNPGRARDRPSTVPSQSRSGKGYSAPEGRQSIAQGHALGSRGTIRTVLAMP